MKRPVGVCYGMMLLLYAILALSQFLSGCSDKKEPLPGPGPEPPAPVIDARVSFNQVPTGLGTFTASVQSIREEDGTVRQVWAVPVADWLASIPGVEAEAYRYDLIDGQGRSALASCLGGDLALLPTAADLAHAYFHDAEGSGNALRVVWDREVDPCWYADRMDGGALPAYPLADLAARKRDLAYVMEMDGDTPVHLGETVYVEGTATVGTGVMVSGRYLKFHIQDETAGVYVFADAQASGPSVGYDGSTFLDVNVYEGNRVFLQGIVGEHNGMPEFYPVSGYALSVTGYGLPLPAPRGFDSVDALYRSGTAHVGSLVRVNGVRLTEDSLALWPPYGSYAKELGIRGPADLNLLYADIYPGSGIPGSMPPPEDGFDIVGVLHRQVSEGAPSYTLYPRALHDLNPLSAPVLAGTLAVRHKDQPQAQWVYVDLGDLPQGAYDPGPDPSRAFSSAAAGRPVVTLASLIVPEAVLDPKKWEYKIKARDGRQPFEAVSFNQLKSGVLYAGEAGVDSHFFEGMGLSKIYNLNDVAEVIIYPLGGGPQPGPAEHGQGINLFIDGTNYPVNFADLSEPERLVRALTDFIPVNIIDLYSLGGSFSYEQITVLYDYEFIPYGAETGCFPVAWDEIEPPAGQAPTVDLSSGLPVLTGLGTCGTMNDLFTIRLVRKVILERDGVEQVFYWKDLPARPVGSGEETVQAFFFEDLLAAAGLAPAQKFLYEYFLYASDDFGTWFTYGHNHLADMYFDPLANRTYSTWAPIQGSGRVSVKALLRVELAEIPQGGPGLICIPGLGCMSDPENTDVGRNDPCFGCHVSRGAVAVPVNCAACHN